MRRLTGARLILWKNYGRANEGGGGATHREVPEAGQTSEKSISRKRGEKYKDRNTILCSRKLTTGRERLI